MTIGKLVAGSVLALALLGFAPVNAAPAGSAAVAIDLSDVAPAADAVHYRNYKHKHVHGYREHRHSDRGHRGYRNGHVARPGIYLNLGGDRRGHRDGYRRNW